MKNIPVFDTENGVASLILREIPYTGKAYVKIQSSQNIQAFIEECRDFCRLCGAQKVYASDHSQLEQYPLYATMVKLQVDRQALPTTNASLVPVESATLDAYIQIYNEKMRSVPNSAWMDRAEGKKMLDTGSGYFVEQAGKCLGVGSVGEDTVQVVISLAKGGGREVLCALAKTLSCSQLQLTVARENRKAMALYESLGFVEAEEISRWYEIL